MLMDKVIMKILVFFVRFCVWFFVVMTVISVSFASIACVVYPDSQNRIMASGGGANVISAWGLTYSGWGGAVLGMAEVIIVVWALLASRTRKVVYRRTGHIILILWAGLWAANAFYVFGDGTFGLIYVMPFFLLCTCLRALPGLRTLISI
jgi:hypothetical protein